MTRHRRDLTPDRRDESGVVAPSRVMLVAIVLVAIAAATYVAGLGSGGSGATDTASTASSREAPSTTAAPSATASTQPSTSAPSSPTPTTSATPKPSASATPPAVQRGQVDVSVFNNSSRTGLAAQTSGKVKDAGWKVVGTDNWYGSIPQPTVYYPARLEAAARLLAKDAGIDRVRPAVNPMRSDRLTLIVTGDYRL